MVRRLAVTLFLAVVLAGPAAAASTVEYVFTVRIDPATRDLRASGTVTLPPGDAPAIILSHEFAVDSMRIDGQLAPRPVRSGDVRVWRLASSAEPRRIEVRWRGKLTPLDTSIDHRQTLGRARAVAGPKGTYLPAGSAWYPMVDGALASYRLELDLPAGTKGLAAGRLVEEKEERGRYRARFEFADPVYGIDVMAGPYVVEERSTKAAGGAPVRLRTYFHPEVAALAGDYLESAQRYIALYERWIGAYPFDAFSVVSSPTPTGFGMPTLTYLGTDVLKLPFIRQTSLGHEVLHNWWGNGVYPDYARGNWSEGLTTFMADYAYKEQESAEAAREMRLSWLRDFAAIPPGQDRPLVEFTSRTHGTSQIVGYAKAAMTFFMLRDVIGREAFDRGIRAFWEANRFRVASWKDLERAFEGAAGHPLDGFFDQWLTRQGAPEVRLADAVRERHNGAHQVTVTLTQTLPAYSLRVPLAVRTEQGTEMRAVQLESGRDTVRFEVGAKPLAVVLDPDVRLLRRLAPDEAPPILRQVMVDPGTTTVIVSRTAGAAEAARRLADRLLDHAGKPVGPDAKPGDGPLLVIGLAGEVDAWLAGNALPARPPTLADQGSAQVWSATLDGGQTIVAVSARDPESLSALVRPLPHYGRQSYLVFEGGRAIERGVWPTRPQTIRLE